MAALLAYMEFQFETFFQYLLQTYIVDHCSTVHRMESTNQIISLLQSWITIIITMSNVWIPQLIGTRQYVPTLKTKVWQFSLNYTLFSTLLNTLTMSASPEKHPFLKFVILLYAGMCSTMLLHNNWCKTFRYTNRLKSCLLTLLFLIKLVLDSLFLYVMIHFGLYFHIPIWRPIHIQTIIQVISSICTDTFFVFLFGKSALNAYSLSSIWNLEPTIISKPLFCAGLFLASFYIACHFSYYISSFMYN